MCASFSISVTQWARRLAVIFPVHRIVGGAFDLSFAGCRGVAQ
jgi:hypothetical protein